MVGNISKVVHTLNQQTLHPKTSPLHNIGGFFYQRRTFFHQKFVKNREKQQELTL